MKLWKKILVIWLGVAMIHLVWGTVIIFGGGTLEDAKAATYPLKIVVFALSGISVLAMIKGEGKFFKHDERTQKLSGIAFRYAWLGIMMSVAALIGIETFYPAKLTILQVLSIMGAAVLIIPFVLLHYFERKGDAQ